MVRPVRGCGYGALGFHNLSESNVSHLVSDRQHSSLFRIKVHVPFFVSVRDDTFFDKSFMCTCTRKKRIDECNFISDLVLLMTAACLLPWRKLTVQLRPLFDAVVVELLTDEAIVHLVQVLLNVLSPVDSFFVCFVCVCV